MILEELKQRWLFFESQGPEYSLPVKRCYVREGIPSHVGALFAALYSKSDFRDLIDFELFQWYSSSIQQDLIATGEVHREWFYPETVDAGTARFWTHLPALEQQINSVDIDSVLHELHLPKEASWILQLEFEKSRISINDESIEFIAATPDGYFTMFVVDSE